MRATGAFAPRLHDSSKRVGVLFGNSENNDERFPNPFKEAIDMFSNFDDVIDDFFYKRMGNGEVFYGKRKYKPSGNVEGEYNGMGLTDKLKIDISRERKAQFLEEKRRREEEQSQK